MPLCLNGDTRKFCNFFSFRKSLNSKNPSPIQFKLDLCMCKTLKQVLQYTSHVSRILNLKIPQLSFPSHEFHSLNDSDFEKVVEY